MRVGYEKKTALITSLVDIFSENKIFACLLLLPKNDKYVRFKSGVYDLYIDILYMIIIYEKSY